MPKRKITANLNTEVLHVKLRIYSGGIKRGIAIPLLSLRVRVHRERGSRNTLSLCVSLVTFSTARKSPHGVTGSKMLYRAIQKAALPDLRYVCFVACGKLCRRIANIVPNTSAKGGLHQQPAPRRIFSFYGKTLRTLDIFPFWMYPYIKQYTVIYPAAFSVCSAGNLSASIISDARRVYSYKKWN